MPQAFAGDLHINGSRDLIALDAAGRLQPIVAAAGDPIDTDRLADEEIAKSAEDIVLRDYIPESDGTHSDDPEQWAILRFYKDFFGFWPNCFYFQHHWPESYKLFVYAHNVGAIGMGRTILGEPVMMATGFSTSEASGCNYCQVHMTSAGGEKSLGVPPGRCARVGHAAALKLMSRRRMFQMNAVIVGVAAALAKDYRPTSFDLSRPHPFSAARDEQRVSTRPR